MKILLAVDTSDASQVAAREIASRPWPAGTTAQVVNVIDSAYDWDILGLKQRIEATASETVRCAARQLLDSGIKASTLVLSGDPRAALIDQAADIGADLIVVGTHDLTGLTGFLLGSVARAVVRHAPCSVEIVRAERGAAARKVLLATDGSPCSEIAAQSIAARPWPPGTEIRIMSVVELEAAWFRVPYPPYFSSKAMEELRASAMKRAQEAVMYAEKVITDAGLPASGTVSVPSAKLKELILNEAVEWGADLIVVGSHGWRGANRFLLGSVSEPVAFHAPCSVEIIRQKPS